jgi:hypothetical protein
MLIHIVPIQDRRLNLYTLLRKATGESMARGGTSKSCVLGTAAPLRLVSDVPEAGLQKADHSQDSAFAVNKACFMRRIVLRRQSCRCENSLVPMEAFH